MTINIKGLSKKDIGREVYYLTAAKKTPEKGIIRSYDKTWVCVFFPLTKKDEIYSGLVKQNLLSAFEKGRGGIRVSPDELQFVHGQQELFFKNLN